MRKHVLCYRSWCAKTSEKYYVFIYIHLLYMLCKVMNKEFRSFTLKLFFFYFCQFSLFSVVVFSIVCALIKLSSMVMCCCCYCCYFLRFILFAFFFYFKSLPIAKFLHKYIQPVFSFSLLLFVLILISKNYFVPFFLNHGRLLYMCCVH